MRSILSADPTFFYCPNSNCKSGQIHDTSAEGNIFRCNACGHRVCTDHDPHVPFHEGETCTQYTERIAREIADREDAAVRKRERQQQDEASLVTVKRDAVECPGCGVMIHKTAGCDHMTCK